MQNSNVSLLFLYSHFLVLADGYRRYDKQPRDDINVEKRTGCVAVQKRSTHV